MIKKSKPDTEVKAVKLPKKEEDWMTKKWRPLMALMYMGCCLADFFLFPIMFTVVQFWETQAANDAFRQWVPITLQGGGLFHVAMGAVLGVTAYGRTQEKLNGATTAPSMPSNGPTTFAPAPAMAAPAAYSAAGPVATSWGSQSLGSGSSFGGTPNSAPPGYGASSGGVTTGFGGKLAPPAPDAWPER